MKKEMEGLTADSSSHKKLSHNKSDSFVVMSNEKHGGHSGNKRRKSTVSRVSSLPGDTRHVHYQHLQTGSAGLKRSRSSRRSYRGRGGSPRASSSEYNGSAFSTPGMAKAELLLQNSASQRYHHHNHHADSQQLEVGESLTNYSGASITSLKLSTPPVSNHPSTRQSFRGGKPRNLSAYGANRGRRASAWSGEQMRGDMGEIVQKIVKHPQSIVSFAVIVVVIGVLLIVIALSASSKLMQYIGIAFISTGILVFVLGAAWFYNYSKSRELDRSKSNSRSTNLRLISLQALEEEGKREGNDSDVEEEESRKPTA